MQSLSRQEIVSLIEAIRERPSLYERNHKLYRCHEYKDRMWSQIQKQTNIDETICRKAWRSLRDQYTRYTKDDTSKIRYRYAKHMTFLLNSLRRRNRYSGDEEGNSSSEITYPLLIEDDTCATSSPDPLNGSNGTDSPPTPQETFSKSIISPAGDSNYQSATNSSNLLGEVRTRNLKVDLHKRTHESTWESDVDSLNDEDLPTTSKTAFGKMFKAATPKDVSGFVRTPASQRNSKSDISDEELVVKTQTADENSDSAMTYQFFECIAYNLIKSNIPLLDLMQIQNNIHAFTLEQIKAFKKRQSKPAI